MNVRSRWGFWRLLIRHSGEVFNVPEFIWALVAGLLSGFLGAQFLSQMDRLGAAERYLVVGAALLAIVFAAMAIMVALASTELLVLVEENLPDGLEGLLWPFIVGIGIHVASVISTVGYLVTGPIVVSVVEEIMFGWSTGLAVWAVLDLVALGRMVAGTTEVRGRQASLESQGVPTIKRNGTES